MCAKHLHACLWLLALALGLLAPAPARAWVETSIRSHSVVVDLDRSGKGTVSHELVIKVRGGPLQSFTVQGVDTEAELLPDATVARMRSDNAEQVPLLLHQDDDGTLTLEVDSKKGLRYGVYLFRFRYALDFVERGLLTQGSTMVDVRWVGPRLDDGIDSAKATFRLPKGDSVPRLAPPRAAGSAPADLESEGILVSQLTRAADKDELELVRAHVAKGEPAVWKVQVSPKSFQAFTPPELPTPKRDGASLSTALGLSPAWLLLATLLAFVYGGLVALKWLLTRRACRAKGCAPRSLVPLPCAPRAALSGVCLSSALVIAITADLATLAGTLLVVSMALAAQLNPRYGQRMRGPGDWRILSDNEAFMVHKERLPGRFLDTGALPGFLVFVALLAALIALALGLLESAPYHALLVLLSGACLLPVFCTGRASELPPDPVERPRRFFASLARQLRKDEGLLVAALARYPIGGREADELRLLVTPERMPAGFSAIEVALEYQPGTGGIVDLPCVIVRVKDDSNAYFALARSVVWTRGRSSDERVAVLRPELPTRAQCAFTVRDLVSRLRESHRRHQSAASSKRRMSSGRGARTSKGSTPGSLQAR